MAYDDSPSKTSGSDYNKLKKQIDNLITQWSDEEKACEARREVRKKEVNVKEMQESGELLPDETYIARRLIDQNIRAQKPEYIAYLEQAPRLVLFRSRLKPGKDTVRLADFFANGMKYTGWNEPWHRLFDGTLLHGANFIQVRFNPSLPFMLEFSYVPREFLIFPVKTRRTIQRCEMILRAYDYLPNELEDFVEAYDFNAEAVKEAVGEGKEKREEPIRVYNAFRKVDGLVETGWFCDACKTCMLKDFEPFTLALFNESGDEAQLTAYPFFHNLTELIEEEEILNVKGRAFHDLPDQEALSHVWTSTVNGATRASDVTRSLAIDPSRAEMSQAQPHQRGTIHPQEIVSHQADYPDPILLQIANQLSTTNQASGGRIDYAVSNRKDARKTRAEIVTAREQQQELSSVNIVPTAICLVQTCEFIWIQVRSQVLAGVIAEEDLPEGLTIEDFLDEYDLLPAGDVEVLKRAEKITAIENALPMFAQTPLYLHVLIKYIELRFPEEAPTWIPVLMQAADLRPVVAQFIQLLQSLPTEGLAPEQVQAIQAMTQNAEQSLAASGVPAGAPSVANSTPNNSAATQPTTPTGSAA